jgi:predicted ribonuclease YlaK
MWPCFAIQPSTRFVLQAADEDEMAEWLEAIQNNLECMFYEDATAAMLPEGLLGADDD